MADASELFSVRGKVALVTGGASGIGEMITEGFVRRGATTYIASRKLDVCRALADQLSEHGTCIPLEADLSTEEGCLALAREVTQRQAEVHILVNNAGATWGERLETFPHHAWDRAFDLNVKAPFTLTQALLPNLRAAATAEDPARVINIGSVQGGFTVPDMDNFSYAASKAAIHQLTRHLAKKLARDHITVNAVAPGIFPSRMMRQTLEANRESIVNATPLGRVGEPDDMVGITVFLASQAGRYLTGTVIPIDGGMTTTL